MLRLIGLLLLLPFLAPSLFAQAVHYDEAPKIWLLPTQPSSYALGVEANGSLQNLYSGAPLRRLQDLPAGEGCRLSYLTGLWAAETQLVREPIHTGMKVLGSRNGHTSHGINPWFAIDASDATEETGRVWFGALAWSGNWRITVEQTPYRQVRVTGGFNTFDFVYPLKPGESLETPDFLAGFSETGFGAQSRLRPVLYNSWEATTFNVTEAGQKALAEKAAKTGVELFVVDDGWFGQRNNDRAGLGDWFVNPTKSPQGLNGLIESVNKPGMDFGLWLELEMINANSGLYRAHPEEGFSQAYAPKIMSA